MTRALISLELHSSVTEQIKHDASDMLTYFEKSSNAVGGFSYLLNIDYFLWWLTASS